MFKYNFNILCPLFFFNYFYNHQLFVKISVHKTDGGLATQQQRDTNKVSATLLCWLYEAAYLGFWKLMKQHYMENCQVQKMFLSCKPYLTLNKCFSLFCALFFVLNRPVLQTAVLLADSVIS